MVAFAFGHRSTKTRLHSVPYHLLPHSPSSSSSYSSIRYSSSSSKSSSSPPPSQLTHIDPKTGLASMVSVSSKLNTLRSATASGTIFLTPLAYSLILPDSTSSSTSSSDTTFSLKTKKGEVFTIAQLAGIMGTKQTSNLIPLCHPLSLTHISVSLIPDDETHSIIVIAKAECEGKTGVEMEALTGCSVALLTVWDMLKAVAGKEMVIGGIKVIKKSGGKSGDWVRED